MHLSLAAILIVDCVTVAAWHLPHPALANSPHQISLTFDVGDDDLDVSSADSIAGLRTFANLPFVDCFSEAATNQKFDIAVFGAPHDTTTTGRPGARFGPPAIRTGSQRKGPGEWSVYTGRNPLQSWATVVDCGDASLTWLDNTVSLKRLDKAHRVSALDMRSSRVEQTCSADVNLIKRGYTRSSRADQLPTRQSPPHREYSRWEAITQRPCLRSVRPFKDGALCPSSTLTVILTPGTRQCSAVESPTMRQFAGLNHGTFLHIAHEEHLILNNSIHAGIRAPLIRRKGDLRNDVRCGFEIVTARDIDKFGTSGVISRIRERVRDSKVYISVDIDVLDPAYAPATGTAEPGGWSTRELLTILEGLEGLSVVGGDVVEVAPAYDNNGETTVLAAAEIAYSLIDLMVVTPVRSKADLGDER